MLKLNRHRSKFSAVMILITGVFLVQCASTDGTTTGGLDRHPSGDRVYTSRFVDGKFYGVKEPMDWTLADFAATTWDYLFNGSDRTPAGELPHEKVDLEAFNNAKRDQLNATWLGHSTLMINIDGYRVLTDPVFEKRVSMVGPTRFNGEVPLDIQQIPSVDAVIISHDHYDHLNKFSVQQLKTRTDRFIVPRGVGARLVKWGIPRNKIVELDWWEEYRFDHKLRIAATPAQHFSGRGLTDRNATLWASWVIATPRHKIFFSGDSGYFDGFVQIGRIYGPFDMTFIECGAYNTSWSQVHMFPEQTVQAHLDLGGQVLHPIHWGTFNLALHPWYEPMERLTAAAESAGVTTATPAVGGTTVYGQRIPTRKWWRQAMHPSPGMANARAAENNR